MNPKRAVEGLVLITIGAILLANTLGGLPWAVWISIISLWPVALISAGIDIIGNSTNQMWLRVVASLLTMAALLYGAFVMTPGTWGFPIRVVNSGSLTTIDAKEAHAGDVTGGNAKVQIGATRLTIEAGSDLAALTGDYRGGLKPTLTVTKSGSTADVRVDYQHQNAIVFFEGDPRQGLKLALDRSIAWDTLELDAGATQSTIDLTGLDVKEVAANVGAADTTFIFGRGKDTSAQINGGMASVTLRVPKGADVTLHVQGLPVNVSVPSGFTESGSFGDRTLTYKGGGDGTIDVGVDGGMATVTVETY